MYPFNSINWRIYEIIHKRIIEMTPQPELIQREKCVYQSEYEHERTKLNNSTKETVNLCMKLVSIVTVGLASGFLRKSDVINYNMFNCENSFLLFCMQS